MRRYDRGCALSREPLRRWLWFVVLWTAGVVTVAAAGYLVKLLLGI